MIEAESTVIIYRLMSDMIRHIVALLGFIFLFQITSLLLVSYLYSFHWKISKKLVILITIRNKEY